MILARVSPGLATTPVGALGAVMTVPFKLMVCGLPAALLTMVTAPVRVPPTVGVNVTVRSQNPPDPNPAPQLFVTAKSPLAPILPKLRFALPTLVKVTVCAALVVARFCAPKIIAVELSETSGTGMPVPVRLIVVGLVAASLEITTLPLRTPAAVGEKVTPIVQFVICTRVALHVVVWAKSPLATMLNMLRTAPPVLVKVMV